jgi:hypothetical protein
VHDLDEIQYHQHCGYVRCKSPPEKSMKVSAQILLLGSGKDKI